MGWTVLYLAFGLVALWLLGEVLLQYKARLRWRLLAFFGFLAVVVGVLLPSVAVIAAGAAAFAVGQTLVTLSFRKGFATGWALGGGPGTSRRRRSEVQPMEPLDDTGELEVYQEYPGEGYGYGYDREEEQAPDPGYAGPEPEPAMAAAPEPGGDHGYQPTEQFAAADYGYPSPAADGAAEADRFAYAETAAFPGFAPAPGGYPGYPDTTTAPEPQPAYGAYPRAGQSHDYGAAPTTEWGAPYGTPSGGYPDPAYGGTDGYGYPVADPQGVSAYAPAGEYAVPAPQGGYPGYGDYPGYDAQAAYPGYPTQQADPYAGYGSGGWSAPEQAGYSETPPGGVWMPQQRDGGAQDGYGYPPPAAQGYYGDGHRY